MHELYTKLSYVIENVAFLVFDVYSKKPVLSGQPVLGSHLAMHSPRVTT